MLSLEALGQAFTAGGVVIVLCLLALVFSRVRSLQRRRIADDATSRIEPLLHAWLVYEQDIETLRKTLRELPPQVAFRALARLCTHKLTLQSQQRLAKELRGERWVATILRQARSPFWWKRFDAGRMLTIVGTKDDESSVAALLQDKSAAVRLSAIDAAARLQGRELVERELDTLPSRQDAVQAYQIAALARQPTVVAEALAARLNADAPVQHLISWIDTAGALVSPAALIRVRDLASHPDANVRVHVARALRRLADPDTPVVLTRLLADEDWRVRAQAARALGALRCGNATTQLRNAVHDKSWWVRYRAGLALAQIGGPAIDALRELAQSDDHMARDMSVLVGGLTSAAVVEMSEV